MCKSLDLEQSAIYISYISKQATCRPGQQFRRPERKGSMSIQKKPLSGAELENQMALELPPREVMRHRHLHPHPHPQILSFGFGNITFNFIFVVNNCAATSSGVLSPAQASCLTIVK